ncbi:MAG TPA: hypothetical protein PLO53_13100, partial [Candidatus Hydrogenedentes bacterium]|nr:hypothetical protein [Candidatus Hydrogenedentota bacterium]
IINTGMAVQMETKPGYLIVQSGDENQAGNKEEHTGHNAGKSATMKKIFSSRPKDLEMLS